MSEQTIGYIMVVLSFIFAIVMAVFQIIWANECAALGGAYIIPQNSFPVCVAGVK